MCPGMRDDPLKSVKEETFEKLFFFFTQMTYIKRQAVNYMLSITFVIYFNLHTMTLKITVHLD